MPPAKKQKTGSESSAVTAPAEEHGSSSSNPRKNDKEQTSVPSDSSSKDVTPKFDNKDYICIPWPGPDYEAENNEKGDDALDEEEVEEAYGKQFEEAKEKKLFLDLASKHPEWKWLIEFNKEVKKPKTRSLHHLWAIMSSMGHWLAFHDLMELINSDDGTTIQELIQVIGHAFLTVLAALDDAGELKQDSAFLDLTLVMSIYLEIAHDLPDYGIEGEDIVWAREVVAYFRKAKLDPKNGVAGTAKLLETCSAFEGPMRHFKKTVNNPWGFTTFWSGFANIIGGGGRRGGNQFDITKMSRSKRAGYAFDGKDPLEDVSQDDLKNNRIMITTMY
ncbi:hypothetical protein K491DRAFT_716402 [Lophiostoma macrostomum CBS 122681]|uniref:Uncharacterized protein n=1 Tax=Lophiostoma macrostomum CBS 122681 TaxID=1314788 RepID=A0A6A6T7X0_9PLEO|nr:hypothetical protein K491DRAFT_716402 [Lophiostoma macrostomum CBS 122681]